MSVEHFAHNLSSKRRTEDVFVNLEVDFEGMPISEDILKGLEACRYKRPSPIQFKAIPLGKCGFDLIVQSKSGTGKTLVFGIVALEMLKENNRNVQVLILTPTREIAVQIHDVLVAIGCNIKDLSVKYFIGGLPIEDDIRNLRNCQIAIGAPGRIKHLIDSGNLKLKNIKLFILDEADQLMQENFEIDVDYIFSKLPKDKQVLAASATYPDSLDEFTSKYMRSPIHVHPGDDIPVLLGLKQFISIVPSHNNLIKQLQIKTDELTRIISTIPFKQCLVFFNYQTRAESISNKLNQLGWPTIFITGKQDQKLRLATIKDLKEFKFRILLSTDLTARGIDVENVNLVINFDPPCNGATYLHRIGRSGRYGSLGISISIVGDKKESEDFKYMLTTIGGSGFSMLKLPDKESMPHDIWNCNVAKFEKFSNDNANHVSTNGENSKNGQKISESKISINQNDRIENTNQQLCKLNVDSSSVEENKTSLNNKKCILEDETVKLEINGIKNNDLINLAQCSSVISNEIPLKTNDTKKENLENVVLKVNTMETNNKQDQPLLSDNVLSGLLKKKNRLQFKPFDLHCQSFLSKKENKTDEKSENINVSVSEKSVFENKQNCDINKSDNICNQDLNDASTSRKNNLDYHDQSFENKLNTGQKDIPSQPQNGILNSTNNIDIDTENKDEFSNTLDISDQKKCIIENTSPDIQIDCSSFSDTSILESNKAPVKISSDSNSENLNKNHNVIIKDSEELGQIKDDTFASVSANELKIDYTEIDLKNTEHGIPMLPDLSTTPQAIQKEKEKQELYLRNVSLLELSNVMIKEKNVEFISFDSYCISFLKRELKNELVRGDTKILEKTCSSIDYLLILIKEEMDTLCLRIKNKFQHVKYKNILKRLILKENLLNEIYIDEQACEVEEEKLDNKSKNFSNKTEHAWAHKQSKHPKNDRKTMNNSKNNNSDSESINKSKSYSQQEDESDYYHERSRNNVVHDEYSRNQDFSTYTHYSNVSQNYAGDNSVYYNFNYNPNREDNLNNGENDWYDMWRRQVFHIKQYVRNTVYMKEMMSMNNYY